MAHDEVQFVTLSESATYDDWSDTLHLESSQAVFSRDAVRLIQFSTQNSLVTLTLTTEQMHALVIGYTAFVQAQEAHGTPNTTASDAALGDLDDPPF